MCFVHGEGRILSPAQSYPDRAGDAVHEPGIANLKSSGSSFVFSFEAVQAELAASMRMRRIWKPPRICVMTPCKFTWNLCISAASCGRVFTRLWCLLGDEGIDQCTDQRPGLSRLSGAGELLGSPERRRPGDGKAVVSMPFVLCCELEIFSSLYLCP